MLHILLRESVCCTKRLTWFCNFTYFNICKRFIKGCNVNHKSNVELHMVYGPYVLFSDQKTEKVTSQKPTAKLYTIQSAKTTERTSSATKQTEMMKPTTKKARIGKAQMTSSSMKTKPIITMTVATIFLICCFWTIRVF